MGTLILNANLGFFHKFDLLLVKQSSKKNEKLRFGKLRQVRALSWILARKVHFDVRPRPFYRL